MVELVVTHSEFMYSCTVCSTNVRLVNHANPLLTKMLSRKRGSLVKPPPPPRPQKNWGTMSGSDQSKVKTVAVIDLEPLALTRIPQAQIDQEMG